MTAMRFVEIDIITCEYPPSTGGVAAYTELLARGLADRGARVRVIAPGKISSSWADNGVEIRRIGGGFGLLGLFELERVIGAARQGRRVLVQYVPTGYGWKNMNLAFCAWILWRRKAGIDVMFHEVGLPFSKRMGLNVVALVNRLMALLVLRAADRIFVATLAWQPLVQRFAGERKIIEWLPVPSNIPPPLDPSLVAKVAEGVGSGTLIGHFGTQSYHTPLLEHIIAGLAICQDGWRGLFIGRGSSEFVAAAVAANPRLRDRLIATGELNPAEVAAHLSHCDLAVQPYPDGITTRRGSAMAWLCAGVPVVTNLGRLSERLWVEENIVIAAKRPDAAEIIEKVVAALTSQGSSREMGKAGRKFYEEHFALEHTLTRLFRDSRQKP